MPSKDPAQRFEDIVTNIQRIEFHIAQITGETAFEKNATVYDAVERCLERISEAATKLAADAETLCPEIPWARIRGLGNVLRHEYDRVEGALPIPSMHSLLPILRGKCSLQRRLIVFDRVPDAGAQSGVLQDNHRRSWVFPATGETGPPLSGVHPRESEGLLSPAAD